MKRRQGNNIRSKEIMACDVQISVPMNFINEFEKANMMTIRGLRACRAEDCMLHLPKLTLQLLQQL